MKVKNKQRAKKRLVQATFMTSLSVMSIGTYNESRAEIEQSTEQEFAREVAEIREYILSGPELFAEIQQKLEETTAEAENAIRILSDGCYDRVMGIDRSYKTVEDILNAPKCELDEYQIDLFKGLMSGYTRSISVLEYHLTLLDSTAPSHNWKALIDFAYTPFIATEDSAQFVEKRDDFYSIVDVDKPEASFTSADVLRGRLDTFMILSGIALSGVIVNFSVLDKLLEALTSRELRRLKTKRENTAVDEMNQFLDDPDFMAYFTDASTPGDPRTED